MQSTNQISSTRRTVSRFPAVLLAAALLLLDGLALSEKTTTVRGKQVQLSGSATHSSVGEPRTPEFVLRNLADRPRTVRLLVLESLSDNTQRAHKLLGRTQLTLPARAELLLKPEYDGKPLSAQTSGLSWHRYKLRITVDDEPLEAIATTAYVCRIPVHLNREPI